MERRPMRRIGAVVAGLAIALLLGYHYVPEADRQAVAAPPIVRAAEHPFDPDWLEVYWVISQKCNGCHRPGSEQTDLSSYEAILAGKDMMGDPLVVPGRPEKSPLWQMVAWNATAEVNSELPDTPAMPEDHLEWLTAGQLETMARWIRNGALEYKLPATCSPRPLVEIDFPSAKECRACHPRQYEQWSRSMHAYAQHSPIFEAFNLTLLERTNGTIGTFCSRCHTPIGTALGENGLVRNVHRSRLSREGVTCVVCHRQKDPYYKSNGRQHLVPGKILDACMFGPFEDSVSLAVGAHASKGTPHIKTSAFCGACHDVTSPVGVRLEEAFSEWQNSPAAEKGQTCQACHMGPIQGVPIADCERPLGRAAVVPGVDPALIPLRTLSDHTFAGPDYSMLPDTEFPEKLDWMYEVDYRCQEALTPYQQKTLKDLRRQNRRQLAIASAKRYELLRNAAEICVTAPPTATAGDRIDVHVDVRSKFGGHSFPTGFTAERQLWVEITLTDANGLRIFRSGDLDHNGDLRDSHSHAVEAGKIPFDRHLLNFQNKFIALTLEGTERSVVLSVNRHLQPINIMRPATGISASYGRPLTFRIAKGSLPPLRTMGKKYPIKLPPQPGLYHLDVKLNFRHLPPTLLDYIGTPHLKHLLEIVVIDHFETVIEVRPDSPFASNSIHRR